MRPHEKMTAGRGGTGGAIQSLSLASGAVGVLAVTVLIRPAALRRPTTCLLFVAAMNSVAYAQSTPPRGDVADPAVPALTNPAVPATTSVPGNGMARFFDLQPTDLMASKIVGVTVYNFQD